MAKTKTPMTRIETAQSEINRLAVVRLELEADVTEGKERLTAIEQESGERALEARLAGNKDEPAKIAGELHVERTAIELTEKSLEALKPREKDAQKELLLARASSLRAEAAILWSEVLERSAEVKRLLEPLEKYEAWRYIPRPQVDPRYVSGVMGPLVGGSTRTVLLMEQVRELEQRAKGFEMRAGVVSPPSIAGEMIAIPTGPSTETPPVSYIGYADILGERVS